jgi:hypothetical protein
MRAKGCLSSRAPGYLPDDRPRGHPYVRDIDQFVSRCDATVVRDLALALPAAHPCSSAAVSPVPRPRFANACGCRTPET